MTERLGENPSEIIRESIRGYLELHSDDTWERALQSAASMGDDLDERVREFLLDYIQRHESPR